MKTIIAGSRTITDPWCLREALEGIDWDITEVVSGGAKGVDQMGEYLADAHDIPCRVFEPEWDQYGKAAGPIRNRRMAQYADALIAVWDGQSAGTENMIGEAEQHDLRVFTHQIDQP